VEYVPTQAMDALVHYSWPGNVRELENLVERAVILSPGKELRVPVTELKSAATAGIADATQDLGLGDVSQLAAVGSNAMTTLEEAERRHIMRALRQTEWRIAGPHGAAVVLGMKRTTLQARMRKLQIRRPI